MGQPHLPVGPSHTTSLDPDGTRSVPRPALHQGCPPHSLSSAPKHSPLCPGNHPCRGNSLVPTVRKEDEPCTRAGDDTAGTSRPSGNGESHTGLAQRPQQPHMPPKLKNAISLGPNPSCHLIEGHALNLPHCKNNPDTPNGCSHQHPRPPQCPCVQPACRNALRGTITSLPQAART